MTRNLPAATQTAPSAPSQMVSPRELSASTLQTVIHYASDQGDIMRRATAVLANYYDPDLTGETRAYALAEFAIALKDYPWWAVQRAFDTWSRTRTRRPSPGEIVILASQELEPFRREMAQRKRVTGEAKADE